MAGAPVGANKLGSLGLAMAATDEDVETDGVVDALAADGATKAT